jgi:TolA-binding protein
VSYSRLVPVLALLLVSPALAQETPDDKARRLLDEGRAYWTQGRLKQAFDNFNIIVTSFPSTAVVGQALLEIGRYRMDVDKDDEAARAAFEKVAREHPQSDAAPGAYYNLGLLTFRRATKPADLEDALAQFSRVETLYPRSEWVPRAIQASAMVERRAGRYEVAAAANRRVALEYPTSDAAPRAQYETGLALALLGQPREAMEEFQRVRNRFPDSPLAERALEKTTALYRLHGGAQPAFAPDPTFSTATGDVLKDVTALLVDADGLLWIASEKTKSAVRVSATGKIEASVTANDPRTLTLTPGGEVAMAAKTALRVGPRDIRGFSLPPEKPGDKPETLDHLLAATVVPGGTVLVSDEKEEKVFRFDASGGFLGTFPPNDTARRKVTRIVVDGEGAILLLDRDDKTVRVCSDAGRTLRTVGPAGLKKPVDIAVDPFRNLYVADEEGGIVAFDPAGKRLFTLTGSEGDKPTALTLDLAGSIVFYDDHEHRIVRYR